MWNPEADKAKRLAKACRSLEKASRGKTPDDARGEDLRAKTVLAMSELLDEFGLVAHASQLSTMLGEFENIHTTFRLQSSKDLSITLIVLKNGEIELCERRTRGDHVQIGRRGFGVREVQVFYKHMLFLLGYELPGSYPRELSDSQPLRFHPLPKSAKEPWILASLPSPDAKRLSIGVDLSQKRALELCRILADPLGWELEA